MRWQDIVVSIGTVAITVGLVPAVLSRGKKPPTVTSLVVGTMLVAFSTAYLSLGLVAAGVTTAVQAGINLVLAAQQAGYFPRGVRS